MLQRCAEDLQRLAPQDPATRRALSLLASRCPPARFWTGWLAIVAALVFTMGRAARRFALRRRAAVALAATAGLWVVPAMAHAEPAADPRPVWMSKWSIDDAHPESSLPSEKARNAEPLQFGYWLQDLVLKADLARAHGDHVAAARFFAAMAQAVPDRAVAFVKLCEEYDAAENLELAIQACGDALLRDGVMVKDYVRFVDLVVSKPDRLSTNEIAALAHVVQYMKGDPASAPFVDEVECKVGTRTSDVTQLRECTAALAAREPANPKTLTYKWALAIQEGRVKDAEGLLQRAKSAGVPVHAMVRATEAAQWRQREQLGLVIAGLLMLLGTGAAGYRFLRRRNTRADSGTEAIPSVTEPTAGVQI